MRPCLAATLGLAFVAGAAEAAPDPLREAVFRSPAPQAVALPERSEPPHDFGMPRTAVERRFGRSGVTGAAGFLCGLQPKTVTDGAAAAYGVDPHGRFVGVKLSVMLR
jgi:hypothetical protein